MLKKNKKLNRIGLGCLLVILLIVGFIIRDKTLIKKEIEEFKNYSSSIDKNEKKEIYLRGQSFNERLLVKDIDYEGEINTNRDLGYLDIPILRSRYMINRGKNSFFYDKKSSLPLGGERSTTNLSYDKLLYRYILFNRFDFLRLGDRFYIETIFGKNVYQIEEINKIKLSDYGPAKKSKNANIIYLEIREGKDSLKIIRARKIGYSEGLEKLDREDGNKIIIYLILILVGFLIFAYLIGSLLKERRMNN